MKRPVGALIFGLLGLGTAGYAQSSLDMLQRDLDQMKQEHQEASSKNFDYFLRSLETAQSDPQSAEKLYYQAGGAPPPKAAVMTKYEHETPTEEAARRNLDQAVTANFDGALQLHCALMRFAALFVAKPDTSGLQDGWIAWLKSVGPSYPQVGGIVVDPRISAENKGDGDGHSRRPHVPPGAKVDASGGIKALAVRDSPIGSYLGFHGWGDKAQGGWRLADLPGLYRQEILEPLRKSPSAATLAAWDVYIAMMNADQPDEDRWADIDYPAFQFDKGCDDFAGAPNTDKLEALMGIIKAHPEHPRVDEWFGRVHDLLQAYRAQRAAASSAAP